MASPRIIRISPKTTWRDVFFILFRQKNKLLLFFVLIFMAVTVSTIFSPSIYRAQAKILFKIGRESLASDPTLTAISPILSVGQSRDAEIQSEIEILTSEELAAQVVRKFGVPAFQDPGLASTYSKDEGFLDRVNKVIQGQPPVLAHSEAATDMPADEFEEAVQSFKRNLVVDVSSKSNIISISIDAYGPTLAELLLESLLEVFAHKHIMVHRNAGSLDFFKNEAGQQHADLNAEEALLKKLKMDSGVGNVSAHIADVMDRIKNLREEMAATESSLAAAKARLSSLLSAATSMPDKIVTQEKTGVANLAADTMSERLFELRLEEQRLLSRYEDSSPPVLSIREQITRAEAGLSTVERTRTEATSGVNEVRQQIMAHVHEERANVVAAQAKQQTLSGQISKANAELRRATALEARVVQVERNIRIMKENYLRYLEKTEQARITSALENENISNISLVQAPFASTTPIAPKRLLNLCIGFLLALFGSFGFAYLAEIQDNTLKKPEEVENILRVPVLVSIPNVETPKNKQEMNPILAHRTDDGWKLPGSVRNAFKTLRDMICTKELSNGAGSTLLLFGTQRREGVTSSAVNLAFTLTAEGKDRVLLIDVNTPNPMVHALFGHTRIPGLSCLISDNTCLEHSAIRPTDIPGLDILPAGSFSREKSMLTEAKLFESPRFQELLTGWKERYDYIVFDAPPLDSSSGTLRLSEKVDGVVWIIEAEKVHRHAAYYSKELLSQAKTPLLGCIFNRRRFYVPRWLYGK